MPQEPIDLLTLLRKRRTSIQQWLFSEKIVTQEDFYTRKQQLESNNAYFISSEMENYCINVLPFAPGAHVPEIPLKYAISGIPLEEKNMKKTKNKKSDLQRNANDVILTTEAKMVSSSEEKQEITEENPQSDTEKTNG